MRRSSALGFVLALALGAAASSAGAATASPNRVVLLPFDNIAHAADGAAVVTSKLELALAARGYEVVRGGSVEELLRAGRVRYLDSVPLKVLHELAERHGAGGVVVGSLLTWTSGVPTVAVSARLLAPDGACLWSNAAALAATETGGAFGRGRVKELELLARRATDRLVATLPAPADLGRARPRGGGGAAHVTQYRSPELFAKPRRLAILPLENVADEDASVARIVDALLRNRLAVHSGLAIVEPAELRAAIVAEGVTTLWGASPEKLKKVGDRVGTTLFLRGAVLRGLLDPEQTVELHLYIVDVEARRVLWSALQDRSKAEFEKLLGLGNVDASVTVADRVVLELVESLYEGH
jgi:TolB-like protein